MDEASARRVVFVHAYDAAESPLWTPEDREWASRLAAQTTPAAVSAEAWLVERARHALQRLAPRDPALRRALGRSPWRWRWLFALAALAAATGLLIDLFGRRPYIDLLAAPVWAIVGWNLVVYALLLVAALRGTRRNSMWHGPRRWLLAQWQRGSGAGPLRDATLRWAALSAPLAARRASALLHVAAAALAAGLIAGSYLRALVFDFRVGWQSTFLDAATVRAALGVLLAPAGTLTGIALPDAAAIDAMRVTPAAPEASASAASWIHLHAATLVLFVIGPRLVLALLALLQAWVASRRVVVPLEHPLLEPTWRRHRGVAAQVRVLPYAAPPAAQAALGMRALLARVYGETLQVQMAETTPVGDEESAAARAAGHADTLRVALVDLGATPEAEHHGRFVRALRAAEPLAPLLLVADESAFAQRFASLPGRLDERRAAWRSLAATLEVPLLTSNLASPDLARAEAALTDLLPA